MNHLEARLFYLNDEVGTSNVFFNRELVDNLPCDTTGKNNLSFIYCKKELPFYRKEKSGLYVV
jgi:hypothetical protein